MRLEAVEIAWRVTVEKHGLILASAALRNNYSRGLLWRVVYFLVATFEEKSAILFIVFSQLKGGCIVGKNFFRKRKMILPAHNSLETFLSFRNTVPPTQISRNTDYQLCRCHNHSQNAHKSNNIKKYFINVLPFYIYQQRFHKKYATHKLHELHYLNNACFL